MNEQAQEKPILLVTGSTGLIGARVAEALRDEYQVLGLDLKPASNQVPGVRYFECDLTDDVSVRSAFAEIRRQYGNAIESVIHLAAYYDFTGEPSEMYERLTVQGTMRLLNELRSFETGQFVFSSTVLVMEPAEENASLTEFSALEDEPWDYPRSKIRTERLIQEERGSIPAVILRIAGVYDDYARAVPIAQQMRRIFEKQMESYFFPGDSSHGQPFVHMDDLIECFRNVLRRREELGPYEVFLVAEPEVLSYKELQDEIGRLIHSEAWTTLRIPKPLAKAGAWLKSLVGGGESFIKPWMIDLADAHYPVSIRHANQRLGWSPRKRLRDTLPAIVSNLKTKPAEWYKANHFSPPDDIENRVA